MQLVTILLVCCCFFSEIRSMSQCLSTNNNDIVQTAVNNGNFKILVSALQAAGLVSTLKNNQLVTVFAPTDAAFNKLPAATVTDLLKPENKAKLTRILSYHVINGKSLTSAQINAMKLPTKVQMLSGDKVTVCRSGRHLKVNNSTVITPDITATNGIIHVIDTVLLPSLANLATSFVLHQ